MRCCSLIDRQSSQVIFNRIHLSAFIVWISSAKNRAFDAFQFYLKRNSFFFKAWHKKAVLAQTATIFIIIKKNSFSLSICVFMNFYNLKQLLLWTLTGWLLAQFTDRGGFCGITRLLHCILWPRFQFQIARGDCTFQPCPVCILEAGA